jgi:MYXO-CTERM domain-containing protein
MRIRTSAAALVVSFAAGAVAVAGTRAAHAKPITTYVTVDSSVAEIRDPLSHGGSHILYLNRCKGGETFSPGYNDSRNNRSSILGSTRTLPEYAYGDASWNELVTEARDLFRPFGVIVTDEDPGNEPHHEALVCGHSSDAGMPNGVGGVAPFSCGVIENSITFSFPEVWGNQPRIIAEVVAQEAAHAWGLDHEYLCEDPMTYLVGCGKKAYRDEDARCGEYEPRNCQCGGATQNSYQAILAVFGNGTPTPPDVTIVEPFNNKSVSAGFRIQVEVEDSDGVERVELWVDGALTQTVTTLPYVFNAPHDLTDGAHEIQVKAFDSYGAEGSDSVFAIVGEPCDQADDCEDGEACVDGRCVAGPGSEGGLGEECGGPEDCASGLCPSDGDNSYCTEPCELGASGCPGGFDCVSAGGEQGFCWPNGGEIEGEDDSASSMCAVGTGRGDRLSWVALGLFGVVALIGARRRRRG